MPDKALSASADNDLAAVVPFPRLGVKRRPPRARILEAMLETSGELGYENVAVRHVIERAKTSRATFYKNFADLEDCFAEAYDEAAEWLYRRVMSAARRQSGWREGLRAGMAELLELCSRQPLTARALFVEVHAAGERALARRNELMGRFAEAIDGEREGQDGETPGVTATFMVGAIETMITAKLMDGDAKSIPDLLPGILHFVVLQYLGEEAAWEEMTAAPLAQWSARREAASELPS
ncbi:MAG TPA: TetR/AcrR family transcriptional regulator [Solirubrobacterales bacterium]